MGVQQQFEGDVSGGQWSACFMVVVACTVGLVWVQITLFSWSTMGDELWT